MYSKEVLKIFANPLNAGRIVKPEGIAENTNADNTANVEFSLRIESNIITDAKFRAQANPYIIAVCDTIASHVKNKLANVLLLDEQTIKSQLGENEDVSIQFCIDCVKLAVADYVEKMAKSSKTKG